MQHLPTHRPSNAPLLIAAIGIGALVAYSLASPRRRAMLSAAGESALEAGSRLARRSTDATSEAASTLRDAADRSGDVMHKALSRAKLPRHALRSTEGAGRSSDTDDGGDGGGGEHVSGSGEEISAPALMRGGGERDKQCRGPGVGRE